MCAVRISVPHVVANKPNWPALRAELNVHDDPSPELLAEADAAAARPLPPYLDRTDIELFTLDPTGSMDLDQAMFLSKVATGYHVTYAIADVAFFVTPGGLMDKRAHEQGETFYGPDINVPLHPFAISDGVGSLLPEQTRPALLWELELDDRGELTNISLGRALVKSRRRFDYDTVEAQFAAGSPDPQLQLLKAIGELRQQRARDHDAVDLPTPEQEVVDGPNGPVLTYRAPAPSEGWNAQISLLTGMAAAQLMIEAKVGLLRTLPAAHEDAVESLRLSAQALGVDWPEGASYGDVISATDPNAPNAPAFLTLATRLLRGAAYVAFNGEVPERRTHSGVGGPYAHCTAPLRRMADRYVNEICVATKAQTPVPQWVLDGLTKLPSEMTSADQRAHALERAVVEAAEAFVMSPHVGETFDAVVVEVGTRDGKEKLTTGGAVQLLDPAVRARCTGNLTLGQAVTVKCVTADLVKREVLFALAV